MKKYISEIHDVRTLEGIYFNICKLNQNFDKLIEIAGQRKKAKFNRAGFASYSELQATESRLRAAQKEKQKHCKSLPL